MRMTALRTLIVGACLAGLSGIALFPPRTLAQPGMQSVLDLEGLPLAVSPRELSALTALGNALTATPGVQDAALAAARDAAVSPDARYALARYQLEIGRQRNDNSLRAQALDELIASRRTPRARLASYLGLRGGIAFQLRDFATAGTLWARQLELQPNDPDVLANLAQVRQAQNDPAGAADFLNRAVAARAASGRPVSEGWYRQRLSVASRAGLVEPGAAAAQQLVSAFPTAENWRFALVLYRQLVAPQGAFEIDLLRLTRAVGALSRASEYQRMAQLLNQAGAAAEAKAVLDEGLARALINAGESPTREIIAEVDRAVPRERVRLAAPPALGVAESLVGARRYDEAIALYRAALARPAANAAELNTRLGVALVLAGRRADAEAAFRLAATDTAPATQPGRYADLASFWLAWLAQRPATP
jgi:tetratricopeptide (TPR) repeat protein